MYDLDRENPGRPEPSGSPRPGGGSLVPIVLVVVPLLTLLVAVVAFAGMAGLLMVAAVAMVPAFMILHYVLWGHWLGKSLRDAEQFDGPDDD